jgi:hypothetical protein
MERHTVTIVTAAGGGGTGTFTPTQGGFLRCVKYTKTDYVNNVTLNITQAGSALNLFAATIGNMDVAKAFYPNHDGVIGVSGAADTNVHAYAPVTAADVVTLTIAAGGDTKTGVFDVWIG